MASPRDVRRIRAQGKKQTYFQPDVDEALIESYPTRTVARVLSRKVKRYLARRLGSREIAPRVRLYNGLVVFGDELLDGEGTTVGQDYPRVLNELGIGRVDNLFEFCSGPGYIGFSLLANGFCKHLTLADINPRAVEAQKRTIEFNKIHACVGSYLSDVFSEMPAEEKWDVVVSNPPHFLPRWDEEVPVDPRDAEAMASVDPFEQASRLKARDPDWSIHRRFYEGVAAHMKPGGHVVMQENAKPFTNGMATEEMFIDMIRAGGGEYVGKWSGQTVSGLDTKMFYMISRW